MKNLNLTIAFVLTAVTIQAHATPQSTPQLTPQSKMDACSRRAVAAGLAELKREFPGAGGRSQISNVAEDEDIVSLTVDNQNINDIPLDIVVPIQHTSVFDCVIKGSIKITSEDNS